MYSLAVTHHIEAAHWTSLTPDVSDPRRAIHGHSYVVRLWLAAPELTRDGVVVDLDIVKDVLQKACSQVDHCILNEVAELPFPTMEAICHFLYEICTSRLTNVVRVELERPTLGYSASFEVARADT